VGAEATPSVRTTIIWSSKMHLSGHYSNPSEPLGTVLGWVAEDARTRRRRPIALAPSSKRLENGVIQRAVVRVLAGAGRTLSIAELHRGVEQCLRQMVSKDSVNSCVSTGSRGAQPRFERVAPGRYRLTMPISARRGSTDG
jgi:hypothetical protein